MGLFSKSALDIGYSGTSQEVRKLAMKSGGYDSKLPLLKGCLKAYEENKPGNLRAFFAAYIEFKRATGKLELDNGYAALLASPIITLLEKSPQAADTLDVIVQDMPPTYQQALIDLTLQVAVNKKSIVAVQALVDGGGNKNIARPLLAAAEKPAEAGYAGTAEKARELAMMPGPYTNKQPVLEGCIRAFEEGKPDNLRAFFCAYIEHKRGIGNMDLDEGYNALLTAPLINLLEKSLKPAETLAVITKEMPPAYRQILLDFTLRRAALQGRRMVAETLIDAGADMNTADGQPLYNALENNHSDILSLLYNRGADFDAAPLKAEAPYVAKLASLKQKFAEKTAKKEAGVDAETTPSAAPSPTTPPHKFTL